MNRTMQLYRFLVELCGLAGCLLILHSFAVGTLFELLMGMSLVCINIHHRQELAKQ